MKNLARRQSLYTTLGIIIVSVTILITLLSSTYVYVLVKDRLVERMKHETKSSIESLHVNVANLISSYAENEYINLLLSEIDVHDYDAIIIEDNNIAEIIGTDFYLNGKIRSNNGDLVNYEHENNAHIRLLESSFYSVKKDLVTPSGKKLGSMKIYASDRRINNELEEIVYFTVAYALIISLLLVLILFSIIRKFILTPISNIISIIEEDDIDGVPIEYVPEKGSIEIYFLSHTINKMINAIKLSRKEILVKHEELKLREQRLSLQSSAMNAVVDGIVITNLKGDINWVNPAFEKLTGYSLSEVQGKNIGVVGSGKQSKSFYDKLWETISAGETWYGEVNNKRKDGTVYLEQETITPVKDSDGKNINFVAIKRDITEQRVKEEQLQRTQKIDSLGKLTGGVAHDYNNMLGVILGYAEILQASLTEHPELASYADEIFHAGERGAKLTRKLLSFSRRQSTEPVSVDINTLLRDAQHMLEKTLTVSINLNLKLDSNLWMSWLDASDFEDAILNMCINSMHAMQDGGSLTISTSNAHINNSEALYFDLKPGEYTVLKIEDTGYGIDEETQKMLYDPFFSTKGDKGTGLGLSQVYGFVQRTKGSIKVYSEIGGGTCFSLYFPRYKIKQVNENETKQEIAKKDLIGSETILVVDDEISLRNLACNILSNNGYTVILAEDGIQALEAMKTNEIDLLLTDIIMPNMDGYELAAKVIELYPDVRIQLASGFSDNRKTDKISDELEANKLQKPFNSQQLLQNIRELLDDNNTQEKITVHNFTKLSDDIEWSDSFCSGIKEIDDDHKKLIELVSRCRLLIYDGDSQDEIKNILSELIEYTSYHFQREEKIMALCDYPSLDIHRNVHRTFLKEVGLKMKSYQQGELGSENLHVFLLDWLTGHILQLDKDFIPLCLGREEEISKTLENSVM